jgi:hypothetical protein
VWQIVAIIALIAATAGWTTVAVIALREPSTAAAPPAESIDPNATDDTSVPSDAATHDVPELEALLPSAVNGLPLESSSASGDALLQTDDAWTTSMNAYLARVGKTGTDLKWALAAEPTGALDVNIWVFRLAGADETGLRDALIAAWKGLNPTMTTSQVTLDGKPITKGEVADATIAKSYLYIRDDLVYDIETTDENVAKAVLAALPTPGASGSPHASGSPTASVSPKPSASPAP